MISRESRGDTLYTCGMPTQPPLPKSTTLLHLGHLLLNAPLLVNILPHIRHDRFFLTLFANGNILLLLISRLSNSLFLLVCLFILLLISISPPAGNNLFALEKEKRSNMVYVNIYHITQPLFVVIFILPHIFYIVKPSNM